MDTASSFPMVRYVPFMGVIWVVDQAMKLGFWNGHPDWCNLGQGQPEVGELEGAPARISSLNILPGDQAYGPWGGLSKPDRPWQTCIIPVFAVA